MIGFVGLLQTQQAVSYGRLEEENRSDLRSAKIATYILCASISINRIDLPYPTARESEHCGTVVERVQGCHHVKTSMSDVQRKSGNGNRHRLESLWERCALTALLPHRGFLAASLRIERNLGRQEEQSLGIWSKPDQ